MTARWVVDEVAPARDLRITWQPISLFEKNQPPEDSPYHARVRRTHQYLRVMESVRASDGDAAVPSLYWELATRIHHDKALEFDPADALAAVGLDTGHAAAFDDASWDDEIRTRMGAGLALVGDDVGTPIISLPGPGGGAVGLFGPVITRVPPPEQSLQLWDAFVALAATPGFWELKRTRTEGPDVGQRPQAAGRP